MTADVVNALILVCLVLSNVFDASDVCVVCLALSKISVPSNWIFVVFVALRFFFATFSFG